MVKRRRKKRRPFGKRSFGQKRRQPTDLAPILQQALTLAQQGQTDEALNLLTPLLDEHGDDAELHYAIGYAKAKEGYNNLAAIYMNQGQVDEAIAMLQQAIDANPYYVKARTNLASHLLDEGDIEGAKAILAPLTEASQFTEEDLAFYIYMQARVHWVEGDYDSARLLANTALFYNPDDEEAQSLLQHLDVGALLDRA